ncbi:MAG TPA: TonB family protein [Bdellovibrio sp.]
MSNLEHQTPTSDDQLSRGLGVSFAIHALLVSYFTLKTVFFPSEQIDFTQAVRVDMVALPDKLDPNSLPPAQPKEEAKPAPPTKEVAKPVTPKAESKPEPAKAALPPKPEEGVNIEKVKNQQQKALDKLKALAALDKIKEEVAAEKAPPGAGKKEDGAPKVKGNVLSAGSALTGLAKLEHQSYANDLHNHIKQHWSLPEWLAKKDYKAQAQVFVDTRGNILGRKIVKSSGNSSYDDEVLATIDRAAPFPAPPEKLQAIMSADGIMIGFPE